MNKSNQSKYNKRIQSNILELNIARLNDTEYSFFKRNLNPNRYGDMFDRESSYNITIFARNMAKFKNRPIEDEIKILNGTFSIGCVDSLKKLGVEL